MPTKSFSTRELQDHIAIGALVKNNNGDILCFKHVKRNFWTFPVGKAEKNETADQALIREMKEELDIIPLKFNIIYEKRAKYKRAGQNVSVDLVLFEIMTHRGKVTNAEPSIHSDMKYRSLHELSLKKKLSDMLIIYLDIMGYEHTGKMEAKDV